MHKYTMFLVWWSFLNLKPTLIFNPPKILFAPHSSKIYYYSYPATKLENNEKA